MAPHETRRAGDFGSAPADPGRQDTSTSSPPWHWLVLSLVLAAAAVGVHVLVDGVWPAVLAWLVGGPIAIGVFGLFVHTDTKRRSDPFYAESAVVDGIRRAVVVLSIVAVALNAWTIADHVARGSWS